METSPDVGILLHRKKGGRRKKHGKKCYSTCRRTGRTKKGGKGRRGKKTVKSCHTRCIGKK